MWKILTAQIGEKTYYSLIRCRLFPEEQNGCLKGKRGTGDLQYIDQHVRKKSTMKQKKISYGVDWLQKGICHGPAKLDDIGSGRQNKFKIIP